MAFYALTQQNPQEWMNEWMNEYVLAYMVLFWPSNYNEKATFMKQ
jgi:hypothetical protein